MLILFCLASIIDAGQLVLIEMHCVGVCLCSHRGAERENTKYLHNHS